MANNHGNTPAAWTAVSVAMLGFLVGSVALMLSPVNMMLLWVGLALGAVALPLFLVMARLGFHDDAHDAH
ncbi:HGxxPAAW family protein [Nocardioides sediminis]|uniref:HGxxPAAW family protein n=1 Tax=Nocardioides sediminis TaxID=433648 RepID=UPI000D305A4D|nr:HGxxPAAW family protein [Nocardioides sediminis]